VVEGSLPAVSVSSSLVHDVIAIAPNIAATININIARILFIIF
jgi:hypothetical protein